MDADQTISTTTIESLPIELLRHILLYFSPSKHDNLQRQIRNRLATVSRQWRQIILETPLFWTFVTIYPFASESADGAEFKNFSWYLDKLRSELSRSGTLMLDIEWSTAMLGGEGFQRRLIEVIMDHAPFHRWRVLRAQTLPEKVTIPLRGELSNLETIYFLRVPPEWILRFIDETAINLKTMEFTETSRVCIPDDYPDLFGRLLSLTYQGNWRSQLGLTHNITHLSTYSTDSLPTGQLPAVEHLTLRELHIAGFRPSLLPNLKHLVVGIVYDISDSSRITLPSVTHLSITVGGIYCLAVLVIPRLQFLFLGKGSLTGLGDFTIEQFNTDGRLSPIELTISPCFPLPLLFLLFQRFPRIEHLQLSVSSSGYGNVLMNFLGISHDEKMYVLPRLTVLKLHLHWEQVDSKDWSHLAGEVIEARKKSLLRSVICEWEDGNVLMLDRQP